MDVFELITSQQKGHEGTAAYGVGEQLKDICRREPESAELIEKDLGQTGMGLADAEKKIRAFAIEKAAAAGKDSSSAPPPLNDRIGKNAPLNDRIYMSVCVTPREAEEILRKFYGLPGKNSMSAAAGKDSSSAAPHLNDREEKLNVRGGGNIIDLADFL